MISKYFVKIEFCREHLNIYIRNILKQTKQNVSRSADVTSFLKTLRYQWTRIIQFYTLHFIKLFLLHILFPVSCTIHKMSSFINITSRLYKGNFLLGNETANPEFLMRQKLFCVSTFYVEVVYTRIRNILDNIEFPLEEKFHSKIEMIQIYGKL